MLRSHPIHHARRVRFYDGLLPLCLLAALLATVVNLALPRVQVLYDDWRYGRPRMMHLAASVGHEEQPGQLTRFIAINLDRSPVILELPGGDISRTRTLALPRLVGASADLVPVTLTLALIDDDKLPDLVVNIDDEEFIYVNDAGNFRLISDAERAEMQQNDR